MFLYRLRSMLIFEHDNVLYFNRCVPDAWFQKGFRVADMPTFFGVTNMTITSRESTVCADIQIAKTAIPQKIILRVVGKDDKKLQSVFVNDKAFHAFDAKKGEIYLNPDESTWMVRAEF